MKRFLLFALAALCFGQSDDLKGDLNDDQFIDILDLVFEVNTILGLNEITDDILWRGDMNLDDVIDVLDIIQIVNVVMAPDDCPGDSFECPDNPYECCTNLHSESFIDCTQCHQSLYDSVGNPNHQQQEYPASYCNLCHNPVLGWGEPNWSHIYADISCRSCHQPNYSHMRYHGHEGNNCSNCHGNQDLPSSIICYDCHIDDYLDEHGSGHPIDCTMCHNTNDWDD